MTKESRDTYRRTLDSALTLAGSDIALAVRLKTHPGQLKKWILGVEKIPDAAFLDAVDIVITAQIQILGAASNPS